MAPAIKKQKKLKITPLDRALNRIYRLHVVDKHPDLDRIHRLLYDLGNPHTKTPPIIHIAGTNGKGSTLAYLHAIFENAGYSVHKHTSPHLIRFNERIVLNGKEIDDQTLLALIQLVEKKKNKQPITFFEFCMAMNFYAFSQNPADIALLETGMGGRLDASNVITSPHATIITSIGLDHMRFLGDTVEKIAVEKAGIMKPGTPCFIGQQNYEQLYDIFWQESIARDVPLYVYGKDWQTTVTKTGFDLMIDGKTLSFPTPSLFGTHQIDNAALAIATLYYSDGFDISESQMRDGITQAKWPARMQHITDGALPALLNNGAEIWLDGAHNVDGAHAISSILEQWSNDGHDIHLIFGCLETREPIDLLKPLLKHHNSLSSISFDYPKSRTAQDIADNLQKQKVTAVPFDTVTDALMILNKQTTSNSKILICGSLYLAGKILSINAVPPLA